MLPSYSICSSVVNISTKDLIVTQKRLTARSVSCNVTVQCSLQRTSYSSLVTPIGKGTKSLKKHNNNKRCILSNKNLQKTLQSYLTVGPSPAVGNLWLGLQALLLLRSWFKVHQ